MTTEQELTQKAQRVCIWIPVPEGEAFRAELDALCERHNLIVSEGPVYVSAAVSGAGFRFESGA